MPEPQGLRPDPACWQEVRVPEPGLNFSICEMGVTTWNGHGGVKEVLGSKVLVTTTQTFLEASPPPTPECWWSGVRATRVLPDPEVAHSPPAWAHQGAESEPLPSRKRSCLFEMRHKTTTAPAWGRTCVWGGCLHQGNQQAHRDQERKPQGWAEAPGAAVRSGDGEGVPVGFLGCPFQGLQSRGPLGLM